MKNTVQKISDFLMIVGATLVVIFGFFWPMGYYYLGVILSVIFLASLLTRIFYKFLEYKEDNIEEEHANSFDDEYAYPKIKDIQKMIDEGKHDEVEKLLKKIESKGKQM